MALSFLYIAFVRILQLVGLSRGEQKDRTIEIVMLRHEVQGTKMSIAASWHPDVAIATGKTATPCPWIDGKGSKSSALTKCHPEWMPP